MQTEAFALTVSWAANSLTALIVPLKSFWSMYCWRPNASSLVALKHSYHLTTPKGILLIIHGCGLVWAVYWSFCSSKAVVVVVGILSEKCTQVFKLCEMLFFFFFSFFFFFFFHPNSWKVWGLSMNQQKSQTTSQGKRETAFNVAVMSQHMPQALHHSLCFTTGVKWISLTSYFLL